MSVRRYDYATGIETSDAPSATPPSLTGDTMTLGYADTNYARRRDLGWTAANYVALTAITTSGDNQRYDGQVRLVTGTGELWRFDSASSSTADGETVLAPDSGTGRWHIISGAAAGGGGTVNALEVLQDKCEAEQYGIRTREIDNAVYTHGYDQPESSFLTGYLLEDYAANASGITVVFNPVSLSDSDRQVDSTTSWTATNAGATLSTSGTDVKVGSNKLTFDKNGTNVRAGIRFDRGSQNLSLGGNYRMWFWISLPSLTNFSAVEVTLYADTTSNYNTWTLTTNYAGSALTTGWNLCVVDLSVTTGTTSGGTGWVYTQLARYCDITVLASSAAQTYTGIAIDGIAFSYGNIREINFNGLQLTMHDTSTKDDFTIDASNARYDGYLTLASVVNEGYTAGITNATAAKLNRSTLVWENYGFIGFEDDFSSGEIVLEQEFRIQRQLRESHSMALEAFVDMYTPQIAKVTTVSGGTLLVDDPANLSANYLSGDQIHLFETLDCGGERTFVYRATKTLTANSSATGGITTLTCDVTDAVSGDYIAKQHLSAAASIVAKASNESFTTLSYDDSPNGAQLINQGLAIPNSQFVYFHYALGAATDTLGLRDLSAKSTNAVKVGTVNLQSSFVRGLYSYSPEGGSSANYVRTVATTPLTDLSGTNGLVQYSFWFYYDGVASTKVFVGARAYNGTNYGGYLIRTDASSNILRLVYYNNEAGGSPNTNLAASGVLTGWNHALVQIQSDSHAKIYLNGILSSTTAGTIYAAYQYTGGSSAHAVYFGSSNGSNGGGIDSTMELGLGAWKMTDVIAWKGGPLLNSAQAQTLHNAGVPQATGFFPVLRNEYRIIGQSGQKIGLRGRLSRKTNGVKPVIYTTGLIKS